MSLRERISKRLDLPLRRQLRAAIPSSRVSLVTASFLTLALGTVVYLSCLPSLVAASPVAAQVVEAVSAPSQDSEDKAAPASEQGPAASTGTTSPDEDGATTADEPLESSDELVVTDVADTTEEPAPDVTEESGDSDSSEEQQDADANDELNDDEKPAGQNSTSSSSSSSSSSSNTSTGAKQDAGNSGTSGQQSATDAAQEEANHDYLASKLADVQALRSELDALNSEAAASYLADKGTREACASRANAYLSKAASGMGSIANSSFSSSNANYQATYSSLIGMYNRLFRCAEILNQAWSQNLGYEDASAHQDELTQLHNSAMDAESQRLAEYDAYAAQISL